MLSSTEAPKYQMIKSQKTNNKERNMTKEQVKEWITEKLKKEPKLAEEYKKQKLANLQAQLRLEEKTLYNEGDIEKIIELNKSISEAEEKSAEESLVDVFTERYFNTKNNLEESVKFIKSLTDEDHYIEGVFKKSNHSYIRCKADLEDRSNSGYFEEMCKIYQKGLSKRDFYIKDGEQSHKKILLEREDSLKNYLDIDSKGPEAVQEIIDEEERNKKFYCKYLAQLSVTDAFDQMGTRLQPKEAEKVDQIIKMHDPSVVESAIQKMAENPTKNMIALMRNISESPAQSREELKLMKVLDACMIATGGIMVTMGIVGAAMGHMSMLTSSLLGLGDLGLGMSGMFRHKNKTDNLDEKDVLVSKCINDLLNEVVVEETFNKGFRGK
jgi:hypothetical protein